MIRGMPDKSKSLKDEVLREVQRVLLSYEDKLSRLETKVEMLQDYVESLEDELKNSLRESSEEVSY